MSSKTITMDELLKDSQLEQLKTGDVVEGAITSVKKHEVWVDLGPHGSTACALRFFSSWGFARLRPKDVESVAELEK